jgi:hypothetical protein
MRVCVHRARLIFHSFDCKTITIIIGNDPGKNFYIHEDTIKTSSEFFRIAIDEMLKEGLSCIIKRPDDDAQVFAQYAHWLYYGTVKFQASSYLKALDEEILLAKMYVFGDKILDPKFCNATLRAMLRSTKRYGAPSADAVRIIYEGTATDSPVRKFLIDAWAVDENLTPGLFLDELNDTAFAVDLLYVVLEQIKDSTSLSEERVSETWLQPE